MTKQEAITIIKRLKSPAHLSDPAREALEMAIEALLITPQYLVDELIVQDKKDNAQTTHNKYQEIKEYAWKLYCHAYKNYEQENVLPISTCIEIATKFLAKFDKR